MAEPTVGLDAAALLADLRRRDLVTPEEAAAITATLAARRPQDEPPLHLKILSAIGTALASAFFLGFLGVSDLIDFHSGLAIAIWGAAFLATGIAVSLALRRRAPGLATDFVAQAAFAALAVGKVLVVAGAVVWFGDATPWVVTSALAIVTVATYPVSGSSLDRLLSPYAVFASVLWEILEHGGRETSATLPLSAFCLAMLILVGALVLPARAHAALRPIGLAALAALGTVVVILASGHDAGFWASSRPLDPRPIEWGLVAALIGLIARVAGDLRRLAGPTLAPAVIAALALGWAAAPGIVFALGLAILGHAHHDRPLRVFGILALPAFLALWYYGRDLTLLTKAATLVGSGVLLLLGRGFMAWRGLDRETAA